MFANHVLPLLRRHCPPDNFVCLTLRTTGMGESVIEEKIDAPLHPLVATGLELGYCAHYGAVDVRLTARGCRSRESWSPREAIMCASN